MMTIGFTNGCVAQLRPSVTEPKNLYIEIKGQPGLARDDVAKGLETTAAFILEKFLEPEKNG
jgi:hypothetical protein